MCTFGSLWLSCETPAAPPGRQMEVSKLDESALDESVFFHSGVSVFECLNVQVFKCSSFRC